MTLYIFILVIIAFFLYVASIVSVFAIISYAYEEIETIPPNHSFSCKHIPTGEEWYYLGISKDREQICAAGWPATIADVKDCKNFRTISPLTEKELSYRISTFGYDWN